MRIRFTPDTRWSARRSRRAADRPAIPAAAPRSSGRLRRGPRAAGALVVRRAHHEAVRARAQHREQLARLDDGELAVQGEEVTRLADRAHDVDKLLLASAIPQRHDLVVGVVVAGPG